MTVHAPTLHSFTVEEYHRMADAGIFTEDDRVERIDDLFGSRAIL
jgi:hypothetical protein